MLTTRPPIDTPKTSFPSSITPAIYLDSRPPAGLRAVAQRVVCRGFRYRGSDRRARRRRSFQASFRSASAAYTAPMGRRRRSDRDPRLRRALVVAGVLEAGLKLAALIDLVRRPAQRVRGSKAWWAAAITVVNAAGA